MVLGFDPKHPERGWHPVVPSPFFGGSLFPFPREALVCWHYDGERKCGERFTGRDRRERYEQHYRSVHFGEVSA